MTTFIILWVVAGILMLGVSYRRHQIRIIDLFEIFVILVFGPIIIITFGLQELLDRLERKLIFRKVLFDFEKRK